MRSQNFHLLLLSSFEITFFSDICASISDSNHDHELHFTNTLCSHTRYRLTIFPRRSILPVLLSLPFSMLFAVSHFLTFAGKNDKRNVSRNIYFSGRLHVPRMFFSFPYEKHCFQKQNVFLASTRKRYILLLEARLPTWQNWESNIACYKFFSGNMFTRFAKV